MSKHPEVNSLLSLSRENLVRLLNKIPGKKQLVLEHALMRPLDRVAGMSTLSKCGVENVFKLERGPGPQYNSILSRVYLISSSLIQAKFVADQVSEIASELTGTNKVYIVLLPRKLTSILQLFEEEGIAGFVETLEYSWEFIPLDYDLLSLELPNYFRHQYVSQDDGGLVAVARALWGVKSLFGIIPNILAQGQSAKKLLKLYDLFTNEFGQPKSRHPEIGSLFIFDRDVDYTSTLLSPLTYEGLLDETFSISCGTVEFGPSVTKSDQSTKLQLSSKDKMFEKVRNKHFASIFSVLGVTAKQLAAAQAAASTMNVSQMKQFVQNDLKLMKAQSRAVALHIGASEVIQSEKGQEFESRLPVEHSLVSNTNYKENINYIEECMAQLKSHTSTLRLICLLSHCSDGLLSSDLSKIKKQFLQAYGFHHLVTWNNLVKLGILREKGGLSTSASTGNLSAAGGKLGYMSQQVAGLVGAGKSGTFQQLVKKLSLVPSLEETNLSEPNNAGYVFNGAYIPATCRKTCTTH